MENRLREFIYDEEGIGTVEIVLILVVLIALVVAFRKYITGFLDSIFDNIDEAVEGVYGTGTE